MKIFIFPLIATVSFAIVCCDPQGKPENSRNLFRRIRTPEERAKFQAWRAKFRRNFINQTEEEDALEKVLTNREKIKAHNKLYKEGKVTFKQALWKYSDMSDDEKRQRLMGIQVPHSTRSAPTAQSIPTFPSGPDFLDWRQSGLVGPVHDQGSNV